MFKFKGISSNDMQVVIEEEEHFIARASQRYEVTEIEGRDAAIFDELGYSVVERPIYVQCLNPRKIDDILAWLNGEGVFEYKGRKTTARFYSQLEPQRSSCIKIIDTTFIRDPFWNKANEEFQIAKDRKDKKASGEYIHVEDSSNCRAKIKISGNSEQETRSGKNILENSDNNVNQYGLTATIQNDGSVKISGTSTAETTKYLTNIKKVSVDLIKEGNYTISFKNSKNMNDVSIRLRKYNGTDKTEIKNIYLNTINKSEVLNLKSLIDTDTIEIELDVICYGNREYNFVLYPQLELGSETEYEQYGESPSLDYRSEIKCCGDNVNEFLLPETQKLHGITYIKNDDGTFNISGTATSDACFISWISIEKIKNNTMYTLSANTIENIEFRFEEYAEKQGTWIKQYSRLGVTQTTNPITKTVVKGAGTYVRFAIVVSNGTTVNLTNVKVKLEEGSTPTSYSPYGQGSAKIIKCNKNLLDFTQLTENYLWQCTETINNGIIKIISNSSVGVSFARFNNSLILDTNKTYTISANTSDDFAGFKVLYPLLGEYSDLGEKSLTFKPKESIVRLVFYVKINKSCTISNIQVEENVTATPYEPHQEQSYIIPTQQPMRSAGNIRDTFIKKDDKWYERHNINRKKLDGTGNWMLVDNNSRFAIKITEQKAKIDVKDSSNNLTDCLSNRFMSSTQLNIAKVDNGIAFSQWSDTQYLYLPKIKDSVDELKSYLAANETYVDYPLETPIDIECTEEQSKILDELNNARTYKNVTNITTDSKAILSLDYFAVTDEKIKNEGNIQSRPILILEKTVSEAVELTINNVRFKYNFKNEEYVEIDCENKEVTFEGLNRFRNIEIGYEFPKLNVGENKIVMHLGDCIIKVLRKDRWL